MKTKPQIIGLLLGLALLAGPTTRLASGGSVNYSYDSAGRLILADYGSHHTTSYVYDPSGNLLLASAPAPAIVVGSLAGGQLTLSWPAQPSGFVLQTASALGPGTSWSTVPTTPTQTGNLLTVNITVGSTTAFYRLQH